MIRNKNKGITLVALVVTIIVLLILAAVSINLVLGDNGIITRAKHASNATKEESIKEEINLALVETQMQKESSNLGDKTFEGYLEDLLKKKDKDTTVTKLSDSLLSISYKNSSYEINIYTGEINETIQLGTEVADIKNLGYSALVLYKDGRVKEVDNNVQTIEDLNEKEADNYLDKKMLYMVRNLKKWIFVHIVDCIYFQMIIKCLYIRDLIIMKNQNYLKEYLESMDYQSMIAQYFA